MVTIIKTLFLLENIGPCQRENKLTTRSTLTKSNDIFIFFIYVFY